MLTKELRLLVIIINYKTPRLVCLAIQTIIPQLNTNTDKVCVVDNNSQDNSVEELQQYIIEHNLKFLVDIIASPVNAGFSAGNNIGFQSARARYYFLLNSDAYLTENALTHLLETMEQSNHTGIVVPRLNWENGEQQTSCFYNLTPFNSFLISVKTGFFSRFFKFFSIYEVAIPFDLHERVMPEWLSFASVLIRGEVIDEVGLMDEGYFMYGEDNDYCRRATALGWQLKYQPKATIIHLNQGNSNRINLSRLPKYYFDSRARYFLKFYGRLGLFFANISWSIGRCISLIREMIEQKPKAFHSRMWLDIWTGFLGTVKKHEK